MSASEAQIRANQANSARSTGPKTESGKAISSRNSLKHGLSGEGIVLPESNLAEIEARVEAFENDMKPCSPAGWVLIRRMATLSVKMEISTRHEFSATARNVRHAVDDFDEARFDEADELYDALGENPRKNLRKLRKSPEGVDRLIEAWNLLRLDLNRALKPLWTASQLERAANMTGLSIDHVQGTRLGALSNGIWGDFVGLDDLDGGLRDDLARQRWSKDRLVEWIDLEIAGLETYRLTLDLETIELDRAEAGERVLFDTSKEGILARRYAAEAERHFFKALKEFRQVEAECLERAANERALPPPPSSAQRMGSSREPRVSDTAGFVNEARPRDGNQVLHNMMTELDLTSSDPAPKPAV